MKVILSTVPNLFAYSATGSPTLMTINELIYSSFDINTALYSFDAFISCNSTIDNTDSTNPEYAINGSIEAYINNDHYIDEPGILHTNRAGYQ